MKETAHYSGQAKELLAQLIGIESFSGSENETGNLIEQFLNRHDVETERIGNNIWARNHNYDPSRKTILLNSHHDTVKPNKGYTLDPFTPIEKEGKLFGLGSNDAGGALVSLLMTFLHFHRQQIPYNLLFAATAEEENSGKNGVESILQTIQPIEFGIVGEPTEMHMAVAEKGLMVLDCYAKGESGHAARNNSTNAIYESLKDIEWFRSYQFPTISEFLGPVKMTVTMIEAGYQHNIIPDRCHFVVDVRTTDTYSNTAALETIRTHVKSEVVPRSTRLMPSHLPVDMPISLVADKLGIKKFGSPTTSDQAVMSFPTFKMGPGKSERSHTPDEFIYVDEISQGITGYITLLEELFKIGAQ